MFLTWPAFFYLMFLFLQYVVTGMYNRLHGSEVAALT